MKPEGDERNRAAVSKCGANETAGILRQIVEKQSSSEPFRGCHLISCPPSPRSGKECLLVRDEPHAGAVRAGVEAAFASRS